MQTSESLLPSLKGKITISSSQSSSSESEIQDTQIETESFLATFQILTPLTQQQFYGEGIHADSYFTEESLKNILKVIDREMPSFSWL